MAAAAPYFGMIGRQYTEEKPLVYVDSWEKAPYAFINDEGEPDGFNVELIKEVMARLGIPYEVKLLPQERAHEELRSGRGDISFGVAARYNTTFGRFGRETVTLFDNVMLLPVADSVNIISMEDLHHTRVAVRSGSRALYYFQQMGVPDSLISVVSNMEKEILRQATNGEGGAVWSKMMMEWVLFKYRLGKNYVTVPVDIPSGEYRFMASDTILLSKADSVLRILRRNGKLNRMETHWLSPEKGGTEVSVWLLILLPMVGLALLVGLASYIVHYYHKHYSHTTLADVRSRLRLILDSNNIQVWVYNPQTRRYSWMTSDGIVSEVYSSFDFSRFYPDGDFSAIHSHVEEVLAQECPPSVRTLRCYSQTDPDKVLDVEVYMKELRDEYNKVNLICGLQYDITESKAKLDRMRLLHLRHSTAFNIIQDQLFRYNGDGYLIGVNECTALILGISDPVALVEERHHIKDMFFTQGVDIDGLSGDVCFIRRVVNTNLAEVVSIYDSPHTAVVATHLPGFYGPEDIYRDGHVMYQEGFYYVHITRSVGSDGDTEGYMVFVVDKTDEVQQLRHLDKKVRSVAQMEQEQQMLSRCLDFVFKVADLRIVRYNPVTKELTYYDNDNKGQMVFSQLQLLGFVDSRDIKKAFKAFSKVDNRYNGSVSIEVSTYLRNSKNQNLHYRFDVYPIYDDGGKITHYFGFCRDVTSTIYLRMDREENRRLITAADSVRQNLLRNMSYAMRQPLVSIAQSIRNLAVSTDAAAAAAAVAGVEGGTLQLVKLSDDALLLSRVEAGHETPKPERTDFVTLYKNTIAEVMEEYRSDTVTYNIVETYDSLELCIDSRIVSRIIREAMALSARYTRIGRINTRYVYHSQRLSLVVEDNGQGIPPSLFERIFEPNIGRLYTNHENVHNLSGMEMPICKALVTMLGGTIEVESYAGKGTTTYISLPINMEQEA